MLEANQACCPFVDNVMFLPYLRHCLNNERLYAVLFVGLTRLACGAGLVRSEKQTFHLSFIAMFADAATIRESSDTSSRSSTSFSPGKHTGSCDVTLDYCNGLLYGTSAQNMERLQVAHNSLARAVCRAT